MLAEESYAKTPSDERSPVLITPGPEGLALADVAARHPGQDIIVTLPGAELPFAWQERLRKAAYAAPHIAAAIPLCDAVPFAALVDAELREGVRAQAAQVDRTTYVMSNRGYYEVPRLHPVCVYLRREALDLALGALPPGATDPQQVLDALTRHWTAAGWSCVLCDYLYVGFPRSLPESPSFDLTAYGLHHPLGALRRSVNDAIRGGMPPVSVPGLDARPVQLHVMHFWGGGLDRWVRDFGRADSAATNMILASFRIGEQGGQRLVLYSDPAAMVPVRTWDIARPIRSSASGSLEYRRILEQVVREFEVESIVVSSLIGHSLDALDQPVRTIVVCHDFYPICQAINPMFGRTCERCTLDDLRRCGASNPLNSIFKDQSSEEWHAMRGLFVERLLARRIEVVVPSPSVATTLRQLEPRLREHPIHVIPHGMDLDAGPLAPAPLGAGERLRLVVLGRLSTHKGTGLLRAAAAGLEPHAEVTLLGCGKNGVDLALACGWKAIERYELDELPGLLRALAPHAGVLASVIPETFSYTLSELQSFAIPPLATRLGSFAERVVEGETGFLFEPEAEALVALVRRLHSNPAELGAVARALGERPAHRSTADMLRDYRTLLPAPQRPVARFRVGIGIHTALTEPYRHLTEAYAQVSAAYARTQDAYTQISSAYGTTRSELDHQRKVLEDWQREFAALDVDRRWWRLSRATQLVNELPDRLRNPKGDASDMRADFPWAEKLSPRLLKSPWWIGHIPFAFELVGRMKPRVLVELGTYSGSSLAAFCQAAEASGSGTLCYGIDLWEGDVHMGAFDEALFNEVQEYMAANHPGTAHLVRKAFDDAVGDFADGSVDLLHIDGTHTFDAVSNDFHTWLPKMSERGVVLFHDVNVNMENTGPASMRFGVRKFFDSVKGRYPHFEFAHCWGLGVLLVGAKPGPEVMELARMSSDPRFAEYFARKGAEVSQRFAEMNVALPMHAAYKEAPVWRRAVNKAHRGLRRLRRLVGSA